MLSNTTSQQGFSSLETFSASFSADYRFGPFNIMVMMMICLAGLVTHLVIYSFDLWVVITMASTAIGLAVVMRFTQVWESSAWIWVPI